MDSDKCIERIYASIYSVILGRYQWQLADTLCPSYKDIKSMMGRVSAVPGPLLELQSVVLLWKAWFSAGNVMDSDGAETICTLEEEVWLLSGCGHVRQSALVHGLVSQGRTALSPLSAVGGFAFPIVPLKEAVMGISIRTRLTCPAYTWNFTSFSFTRPEVQVQLLSCTTQPARSPKGLGANPVLGHLQQS